MATLPKPGPCSPNGLERPVEDPVLGEDRAPRVDLHEVARPQRHQHRDQRAALRVRGVATLAMKNAIGNAISASVTVTAAAIATVRSAIVAVDVAVPQRLEVVEREAVDDLAAERVEVPERRDEQDRERAEVRDAEPAERPRQQQTRAAAGAGPCSDELSSALDLRPRLDPFGVVLADRPAVVTALLARRRPVRDLVEVVLVVGVEDLAVVLDRGLRARLLRSTAPPRTTPPPPRWSSAR